MKRIMHRVGKIVIILFVAYVMIGLAIYFLQDKMIYHPGKIVLRTPQDIGLTYSDISLMAKDNINISGWYIPATNELASILFCHGNAGTISDRLAHIRLFNSLNLSVIIFDYRGFGRSQGSPSENGTYLDAEAAWEYLVNVQHKLPSKIIIDGHSLGGAVAAELALRENPGVLVIESSFTSVPDMGSDIYPWFPI
jgi:uncharacterized protein